MKKFLIVIFLLAFLLTGCAIADMPFFESWSAEQLVIGLATVVVTIVQSYYPKVSVIQWVKKIFRIEGELAWLFMMVFLFGVSFLALWVTGEFDPTVNITLDVLMTYYGILLSISQAAYLRLKAATGATGKMLLP